MRTGGWMLLVTARPDRLHDRGGVLRRPDRDERRPRRALRRLRPRRLVPGLGEVARFGAPSLITRSTNDVQQVQMLVVS